MLQTPGLPAAWGLLKNTISSELREDMGTNDITFGQGESKDIPVGTVRRLERLGEIPVAQQLDRLRRAESFGMMVASDIMRSAYTEKRLVRMKGKDGSRIYAMMKAADLPEFDITITADPNVVQFDTDKVNGLLQLFNAPPPVRKQLAKALNISTQTMKEFEDEMKVWEEQQAARQPQGGNTGGGAPTPPAPPPNLGPGGPAGVAPATNGALAGA
jgi:hypothetical protein